MNSEKRIEQPEITRIIDQLYIKHSELVDDLFDHLGLCTFTPVNYVPDRNELREYIEKELEQFKDRSTQEQRDYFKSIIEYSIYKKHVDDVIVSYSHYYIVDQLNNN